MKKNGKLSVSSENIFPIIKKWLYSEHDIFIRELISNASDAISKRKRLARISEAENPEEYKIILEYNKKEQTIKIKDNGLGMSEEELHKYINEVAFSGAKSFVEKFKDSDEKDHIIGHFGLGFYSSFMVSKKVEIETKSYIKTEKAVKWTSEEGIEYSIENIDKEDIGTTITLYLSDEADEFKNEYKIKNTLNKYCSFMPYPIFVEIIEEDGKKKEEDEKEIKAINQTSPLYTKKPNQCKEEEYKEFYSSTFVDFKEPLFWIHLNMEYPFNLKGILYFPKIKDELGSVEGNIKLYNNQVFVADNIKELLPDYLMLLKGVIDCPDLPLNVSRSFLQDDGFSKKISDYVTKKVNDKINELCKKEREKYEGFWNDLNIFVKFASLRENKTFEYIKDSVLIKDIEGKYYTLSEMKKRKNKEENIEVKEKTKDEKEEKQKEIIYFTEDKDKYVQQIKILKEKGEYIYLLDEFIDKQFVNLLETSEENFSFKRVDSFEEEKEEKTEYKKENKKISKFFEKTFKEKDKKLEVELRNLGDNDISSMIAISEQNRRTSEMMQMYSMGAENTFKIDEKLLLNIKHPLSKFLLESKEEEKKKIIAKQLYYLAKIGQGELSGEETKEFIENSNEILLNNIK